MIRYTLICLFGLLLTACATSTPAPKPAVQSREKVTTFLAHKPQTQIREIFGEPTVTRTEGKNRLWAYQTNDCSTLIYFDESGLSRYIDVRGACTQTVANRSDKRIKR